MSSTRPYLIRALHEWIVDNDLTPHLLVAVDVPGVEVPPGHAKDGRIVLNIAPVAVNNLVLGNELVTFQARFGGVSRVLRIPTGAVLGIYARENGQGMLFGDPEVGPPAPPAGGPDDGGKPPVDGGTPTPKKPKLTVVR